MRTGCVSIVRQLYVGRNVSNMQAHIRQRHPDASVTNPTTCLRCFEAVFSGISRRGPEDEHVYTMLSRSASTLRGNMTFVRLFVHCLPPNVSQVDTTVGGTNYDWRTGMLKRTENKPSLLHLGFFIAFSPVHQTRTEP